MRRTPRGLSEVLGANLDDSYDVPVATTEAAADAVEHAYGPVHATFDHQATVVDDVVEIVVRDQGRWRPPRGQNRGRGTLLMQELMDHFEVSTGEEGTVVRMRRRIVRAAALV